MVSGQAKYTLSNGAMYSGACDGPNEKGSGYGTITYANEDIYTGEWKDNQWDSEGNFTFR